MSQPSISSRSPYPGLRPFRRDEADLFFGRDEHVNRLLERLAARRIAAVAGPSGSGKTSLVRAGLLPALEGGLLLEAGARWYVAEMRPGRHPLWNLAEVLLSSGVFGQTIDELPRVAPFLHAALRRGPRGLIEALCQRPAFQRRTLLLVIDSFEELLRDSGVDEAEAEAFVQLLLTTVASRDVSVYVVLTVRSEKLGVCQRYIGLPETLNDCLLHTPRMSREQLRAAILGPAAACGATVEPEFVNELLNDMRSEADDLPRMQHLLRRVWQLRHNVTDDTDRQRPILRLEDYDDVGGLAHALSNHADEAFDALTPSGRLLAERLFRALSERGGEGADLRR
ncbi:MAG TPA: ATP-binding protein, partial [Pirellulaceae bacterium]|nr:ATP-binding protein [Pirellulaceae bacterium]